MHNGIKFRDRIKRQCCDRTISDTKPNVLIIRDAFCYGNIFLCIITNVFSILLSLSYLHITQHKGAFVHSLLGPSSSIAYSENVFTALVIQHVMRMLDN